MRAVFVLAVCALSAAAMGRMSNDDEMLDMRKDGSRLISLASDVPPVWLSEHLVLELIKNGVRFMDITEHPDPDVLPPVPKTVAFPTAPTHQTEVRSYITNVRIAEAQANLQTLSSFFTRYYRSTTGAQSAQWIFDKVQAYIVNASRTADVTVSQFTHSGYNQKSVIARFTGRDNTQPVVILSAHQDSINQNNPANGRSPGADDDGSGSVTILEAFRVLLNAGFRPVYPLEFHWYAGEEAGLLGSADIAASYRSSGRAVYGAFQLDMTGYTTLPQAAVRVVNDYVDASLTAFTRQLIDTYTTLPRRDYACGYACSDHASWYRNGYASATTFEAQTCPQIHREGDDLNLIVWSQVESFIDLTISFAVELTYGA